MRWARLRPRGPPSSRVDKGSLALSFVPPPADIALAPEVIKAARSAPWVSFRTMSLSEQDQASPTEDSSAKWQRRPASRPAVHILNLVFFGVGVFFLVGGYNQWAAVQPIAGGSTTTGRVVSVSTGETCGRYGCSPNWTPTITFETPRGASYTFTGPTSDSQVSTGQSVTVSYSAANPAVAHDISASSTSGVSLIGFGVFAMVLGLGSFVLGFSALHRRTGLSSARQGSGWVGHKYVHSNQGAIVAIAVALALIVVGCFVL